MARTSKQQEGKRFVCLIVAYAGQTRDIRMFKIIPITFHYRVKPNITQQNALQSGRHFKRWNAESDQA
jgi:hypothetical protein